jgi:hypothetical protein
LIQEYLIIKIEIFLIFLIFKIEISHQFSTSNLGGVAGGKKYVKDSILFKFNLDPENIYGGSFLAFKAGKLLFFFSC